MCAHMTEVLLGIVICTRAESLCDYIQTGGTSWMGKRTHLVVFRGPFPIPIELLVPLEILRDSEEVFLLAPLPHLRSVCWLPLAHVFEAAAYPNDWRNELNQKVWQP